MAEIYSAPTEIELPKFDFKNFNYEEHQKKENAYIEKLRQFCFKRKRGKNVGEIIKFQVADGYALYMVASMRPLELIHIPLGDAYDFQYVHLMTPKEVQESIDREKAIAKLFADKK